MGGTARGRGWAGAADRVGALFRAPCLGSVLFLAAMYGFRAPWAGCNGFFTPYPIRENDLPAWAKTMVPASYFLIGMLSIVGIVVTLSDKVNQRFLFGVSAVLHMIGMALLAVFGFTLPVVIAHILIMGVAAGFGAQSFAQL